ADVPQRLADDGRAGVARIWFRTDIHGRVVEVVLNTAAEYVLQAEHVFGGWLHVRADADAPSPVVTAQIELILEEVVVDHVAKRASNLDVAPTPTHAVVPGQIGCWEAGEDVRQFDTIGDAARVAAGAWILDCDPDVGVLRGIGFVEHLCVAE